ncbi:MAG: hypothetical protein U0W24_15545 [Bacteroidales bacterium]
MEKNKSDISGKVAAIAGGNIVPGAIISISLVGEGVKVVNLCVPEKNDHYQLSVPKKLKERHEVL